MSTGEQGITPACAGKSLRCHLRSAVRWDHPRVCGEKWEEELSSRLEEGSPPRVRGKGVDRKIALLRYGITPACAGKRTGAEACGGCSWDHPRVCGEKFIHSSLRYGRLGSPPRVRGKDYDSARIRCQLGITPACAGKRFNSSSMLKQMGDHPRVCGEKDIRTRETIFRKGSPPRVRGKVRARSALSMSFRITPACAGKSTFPRFLPSNVEDHPRVCGEKLFDNPKIDNSQGSPPRVRGKAVVYRPNR